MSIAMKRIFPLLSLLFSFSAFAQGYEIKVTLRPFKNQYIYLGHYYGKQLPIVDSVKLNEKSEGVFKGAKKLTGGIYLVGYPDRAHNFEILVDKSQRFEVIADTATIVHNLRFINSPDNEQFMAYQKYMSRAGKQMDSLYKKRNASPSDSVRLTTQIVALDKSIKSYRAHIISKNPAALLPVLLQAMKEPEVPAHAANSKDSMFAYHYFKNHYFDGINFYDERLSHTPFFETKVDKYFEQLVFPSADSVIKEIDYIMAFAGINKEMEKFFLLKFVNRYLNQKYMWEDAVFVHLFEKYFSQKNYDWITEKGKKIIQDRAYSLMANIFGSPAADVDLPDSNNRHRSLYSIEAPYTLLVIWDPTCGHCKETLPKLDSLYQTKWKSLGLQPYGLAKETDGSKKDWTNFINEHKLNGWINVYYSKEEDKARVNKGIASYSQLFDVQSFPTLYLLDKDKRIIAKKVTEKQIDEILALRAKGQK